MKTLLRLLALLAVFPVAASGQKIQVGQWTGTVTPPGEATLNVTYDVSMKGDTILIKFNAAEHGSFDLEEVKLADGKLTFHFTPGPRIDCTLNKKDDGSFAGQCTDGSQPADMVMLPPKKG